MTSTSELCVLKVDHDDELRRISIDPASTTLSSLKAKLAGMFSISTDFMMIERGSKEQSVDSDTVLQQVFFSAKQKHPHVLRLTLRNTEREDLMATCSACNSGIMRGSAFYKCLHCPSFVFCQACEEKCDPSGHITDHLVVKLRQPVTSLSPQAQLVFASHIITPVQLRNEEAEQHGRNKMEVSMLTELMEEFQQVVVTDPAQSIEHSVASEGVEKEVATWEAAVTEPNEEPAVSAKNSLNQVEVTAFTVEVASSDAGLVQESKPEEAVEMKESLTASQLVTEDKPNKFKANLTYLESMGFSDRATNIALLVKHVNNLEPTIEALLNGQNGATKSWISKFGL